MVIVILKMGNATVGQAIQDQDVNIRNVQMIVIKEVNVWQVVIVNVDQNIQG